MTMKYRRIVDEDYSFGNGAQNFISGTVAVAQAIKTRLLLLQGEWWEDTEDGLPLFQSILGQPGTEENLQSIDLLVQDRIIKTPGVNGIKSFESTYVNRNYGVSCTVETAYGYTELEVTL
jgi:hypothetical protein